MPEVTMRGFRCERCQHEWFPRGPVKPKVCPKCKSPYWDTPKRPRREG
jgi:predicted Zn-ribbon and HTH transcriptional regulator